MKKEDLDILKEKIVDELNWAMDSRKDTIDIMVDVDENNEDTLYANIRAKFTYDGYYDSDVDYYETTSIDCSIVDLELYENNKRVDTPKDFLNEIEREVA
jgi:hypothetical protein|nr:MAG TPA: hypothetical protein [Caudoviricetes sp.]